MNINNIINDEIQKYLDEFDVSHLGDVSLKTNAPQLDRRGLFNTNINNEKVEVLDNRFEPNKLYDYVVDNEGNLIIGGGHYKLSKKAEKVKAAGEIKIDNNGKVSYLNNESGHYEPTKEDLDAIIKTFQELKITSPEIKIDRRY